MKALLFHSLMDVIGALQKAHGGISEGIVVQFLFLPGEPEKSPTLKDSWHQEYFTGWNDSSPS